MMPLITLLYATPVLYFKTPKANLMKEQKKEEKKRLQSLQQRGEVIKQPRPRITLNLIMIMLLI